MSMVVLAGLNSIQALQDKSRELSSSFLTQTTNPAQAIWFGTDISLASPSRNFLKKRASFVNLTTYLYILYIFLVFVS